VDGLAFAFRQEHGAPLVEGAVAHIVARVVDAHQAGDHTLFIGEIEYLQGRHGSPLLFYSGSYGQIAGKCRTPGEQVWPSEVSPCPPM
jgi:flavin reductase (DIM6/NTAB) family NADH-FMN oxidoreductase RutF